MVDINCKHNSLLKENFFWAKELSKQKKERLVCENVPLYFKFPASFSLILKEIYINLKLILLESEKTFINHVLLFKAGSGFVRTSWRRVTQRLRLAV